MSLENKSTDLIFYTTPSGHKLIKVQYLDDTFWLSQKLMAELFSVEINTINYHLKEIFKSEELDESSTIRKIRIVQDEGSRKVSRDIDYFSLDAIISVGYRVNSKEATQFRKWATKTLTEFITKGFVLDDDRLKQGKSFGKDYFDELLERIREIRASERRFYQKITDIYAECSIDYDSTSETSRIFYKTVQNKLHWAITGNTAAELISKRADSDKTNMGLTSWKNSPDGKIIKSDVHIAKNYLNEDEIDELNRIVTMYLDFAELQAKRNNKMEMKDWAEKLDAFLEFNDYNVLDNAGSISKKVADQLADVHYEKFRVVQDQLHQSDFDKAVKKLTKGDTQ